MFNMLCVYNKKESDVSSVLIGFPFSSVNTDIKKKEFFPERVSCGVWIETFSTFLRALAYFARFTVPRKTLRLCSRGLYREGYTSVIYHWKSTGFSFSPSFRVTVFCIEARSKCCHFPPRYTNHGVNFNQSEHALTKTKSVLLKCGTLIRLLSVNKKHRFLFWGT